MSALLDELSKTARTLTHEERAQLVQKLMESIDQESDPEVAQAWETEIASRIARYECGQTKLIPASEVFEAARRLTQ
jgi:putative addiction module component (TIGR02574 family)